MKRVALWGVVALAFLAVGTGAGLLLRHASTASERRLVGRIARSTALVNYRNSLSACRSRGNESRENQLALALILAQAKRPALARPALAVVHRIRHAEFSRPDGTIVCREAVEKP